MPDAFDSECLDASEERFIDSMAFGILYWHLFVCVCFLLYQTREGFGSAWNDIFHRSPPCMQLFIRYDYSAQGRPRFGVGLGLFVDCLSTFSVPGHSNTIEIRYPGPDMQLLLKYVILLVVYLC